MWVRFTADHDFSPAAHGGRVTIAYRAGQVCNVTRECAAAAVRAGRAEKCAAPGKEREHGNTGIQAGRRGAD